jgi:excisionase family DNA binding protein
VDSGETVGVAEAARRASVSERTVRRALRDGRLQAGMIDGRWAIPAAQVDSLRPGAGWTGPARAHDGAVQALVAALADAERRAAQAEARLAQALAQLAQLGAGQLAPLQQGPGEPPATRVSGGQATPPARAGGDGAPAPPPRRPWWAPWRRPQPAP